MCAMVLLAYHSVITYYLGNYCFFTLQCFNSANKLLLLPVSVIVMAPVVQRVDNTIRRIMLSKLIALSDG